MIYMSFLEGCRSFPGLILVVKAVMSKVTPWASVLLPMGLRRSSEIKALSGGAIRRSSLESRAVQGYRL